MILSCQLSEIVYVHSTAKGALDSLKDLSKIPFSDIQIMPTYIFLDIDMPIMDGFQFITEFNKLPEKAKSDTKIIMLTSSLNPKDLVKAKQELNVFKYLNKPLSQKIIDEL